MASSGISSNRACLLVIVALALLALGANPLQDETVGPFDLLGSAPGWATADGVRHPQRSDVLDWQLPQWKWAKERLYAGELPLWNWSRGGGIPGLFDLSTAIATPGFVLFALFPDDASGFYFAILSRLLVAGLGMYLLLRTELPPLSSLVGGLTFMLSGFTAAWLFWPQVATLIWLPWLILALVQGNTQPTLLRWLLLVLATVLLILGGFPSVAAYCLYACALAQLVFGLTARWSLGSHLRAGAYVGSALVLGFALCAPWIAGLYEVLAHVDVSYREYGAGTSAWDLLRSLLPSAFETQPAVESTRYMGTLALLLAACAVVMSWRVRTLGFLAALGLILLIVSGVFIAGVVPKAWVAQVPALNNSPWDRLASILGFAIALLAAVGSAWLLSGLRRTGFAGANALLVLLIIVQSADQLRLFRQFNGPTPARLFFPVTDVTDWLTREPTGQSQRGLHSALVDRSFLVAGTLNYFGLHEWLAHGFKSAAERELLESLGSGLFATRTAANFAADRVDLRSDYLNALGIKFIVGRTQRPFGRSTQDLAPQHIADQPASPQPGAAWQQRFVLAEARTTTGIELHLATYGQPTAPGPVTLQLAREHGADLVELAQVTVAAESVADNAWVYFEFSEPLELPPGDYRFSVTLAPGSAATAANRLTAWTVPQQDWAALWMNNAQTDRSLKFNLAAPLPDSLRFTSFARGIAVIENAAVSASAYFVPSLDFPPDKIRYSTQADARIEPDQSIAVTYSGQAPGWVVLPVRHFPGWHAKLGDKTLAPDRYLGVLPALPVAGPVQISYRRSSQAMSVGKRVSGAALLVGLLLLGWAGAQRIGAGGTGAHRHQPGEQS